MKVAVARTNRDGVVELRLERPESRNSLNTQLLIELRAHLEEVRNEAGARAVIITGAGPAFCAGADLREFGPDAPPDGPTRRFELMSEVLRGIGELEQPTVAAVHGAAIGGGWGIALACDVCFASRDASFSLPELAKGFRVPEVLIRRLMQVVGPVRAAELAFAGRKYLPDEALAAGCVARLFADREELLAAAWDLCTALASHPRHSVATAKEPLRAVTTQVVYRSPEFTSTEE